MCTHSAESLDAGVAGAVAAFAIMLELVADRVRTDELVRYEAALRGNAAYLAERDR